MATFDQPDTTTDPTRIRALAHPVRLALLDHLSGVESATATQCAEAIGESVASCSFHLRTLAKHGFITRAESGDAKSRPWRVASRERSQRFSAEDTESLPAVTALGALRNTLFIASTPELAGFDAPGADRPAAKPPTQGSAR